HFRCERDIGQFAEPFAVFCGRIDDEHCVPRLDAKFLRQRRARISCHPASFAHPYPPLKREGRIATRSTRERFREKKRSGTAFACSYGVPKKTHLPRRSQRRSREGSFRGIRK